MTAAGDVVVIGAGPNGLVAAAYLARSGFRPLVLERRPRIGGRAVTEEIHPGFRASTAAFSAGPMLPRIVRDLDLSRHGFEMLTPEVRLHAPAPDGRGLSFYEDPRRTAEALSRFSARDAARFADFHESLARIGAVLAPLLSMTPPPLDRPGAGDLWNLAKVGRTFRALPRKDAYRLLRWGPMAVADFAAEWFETELARAAVAGRGIQGAFAGPWSAGTTANLLLGAASDSHSGGPAGFVRGGMGALSDALGSAAQASGVRVRTGAEVARIRVAADAVRGVTLADGEEIDASTVVSGADPARTFLRLVDPTDLDPEFLAQMQAYRTEGSSARVHFALSDLPRFRSLDGSPGDQRTHLSGRIHIGPEIDELERAFDAAKYGDFSPRPYCEAVIPTLADPTLAPPGAHVLSVHVQYAPFRVNGGGWGASREALGDAVLRLLAEYAPDLPAKVVGRMVLTPADLEDRYALTGGHLFHGEHSLDQLFTMRPVLGWARYRTPIRGLYLCGSGTHPGGGVTGAPGANASREIAKDRKRNR
jgi:phytoene dehydrogenase-like protein